MNKLEFNDNDYKISVIGISLKNNDYICLNTNSGTITDLFEDLYIDSDNEEYKTEVRTGNKFVFIEVYSYSPSQNQWIEYARKALNIDQIVDIEVYHTREDTC